MRRAIVLAACLVLGPASAHAQTTVNRVPTGNGSQGNWNANAGTRFEAVDDPIGTPDEDTLYVNQTASGQRQSFTFATFAVPGGSTITSVSITARCKFVGTSSDLRINIRNEAAGVSEDTDRNMTAAYADYTRTMATNPFTGAAWTVDQANTEASTANRFVEMEIRSIAPSTEIRCTQVFTTAIYTGGGGGAATGLSVLTPTLGVGR